ncbi:MAG: hypothetical protein AMK73_03655 [Planctomycetes bacterium SM23_32]|nr:MAG: hypothetical protein AMK73_03655 [Planctomycetes bacterium SM23_32]
MDSGMGWVAAMTALALAAHAAWGAEYFVSARHASASDQNAGTAEQPFRTIARAAKAGRAGDTVLIGPGVYREAVILEHSGEPGRPVTFMAQQPGTAVLTGADPVRGWERLPGDAPIYRVLWPHQFIINQVGGRPIEHHPYGGADAEPRWGRAEQVVADGRILATSPDLETLREDWQRQTEAAAPDTRSDRPFPDPADPATWHGAFAVDTSRDELYVWLADGSDPNEHDVLACSRGLLFGTNRWINPDGIHDVHVRGLVFRYGATFPQRPLVWLYGRDNLLEECLVEYASGSGANVNGVMRRCVVRGCGHTGGGAMGTDFANTECLWEANCWKPISRNWDAGGFKITWADGGVFRKCIFRRNGGPGLWMDIHCRDVTVTECVFEANELSGLFVEISRDITVTRNLAVRNALKEERAGQHVDWACAGIQLAESMDCVVAFNTCVGNKDGVTIRELQGRPLDTPDFGRIVYSNRGHVVCGNVCAGNEGYQLGLWYDNGFFGRHPSDKEKFPTEEAFAEHLKTTPDEVFDPTRQGHVIARNLYLAEAGRHLALYGTPWRAGHRVFDELSALTEATGFGAGSRLAGSQADLESAAAEMDVGWRGAPQDVDAWARGFIPAWALKR